LLATIVGVLSLGTLLPSVTQAKVVFTAPPYSYLEGTGSGQDIITTGGIERECAKVEYAGRSYGRSDTLEIEPVYEDCTTKALSGLPAKFVLNGCVYLLHLTGEKTAKGGWEATVDVGCRPEYTLEWHAYETEENFEGGDALCTTDIPPQSGLKTVEVSNTGDSPSEIAIHWNLSGIKYRAYGSRLFCGSPFGALRHSATYEGTATVSAKDRQGNPTDLEVSG